jgi:hypothetical protein
MEIWCEIFIHVLQKFDPIESVRFLYRQLLVCSEFCGVIDTNHIWKEILRILKIRRDVKNFTQIKSQVQYLLTPYIFKIKVDQGFTKRIDDAALPSHLLSRPYYTPQMMVNELQSQICYYNGHRIYFWGKYVPDRAVDIKIDGHIPLFELIDIPKY